MAQTTTAVNGCDVGLYLDDAGGNLVDISGSSNSIDMDFDHELGEYKTFGTAWKGRLACGKDAAFTVKVVYSMAANEGYDLIRDWYFGASSDVARTLRVDIPDSSSGNDRYTAEVHIEKFKVPGAADDAKPIMVSIDFKPHGEVTYSAIA